MADNEDVMENTSRGTEWEVVSLTESAYAAAPGPRDVELNDSVDKTDDEPVEEAETSRTLFMSRHFVFPPSQHENLPLDPERDEDVASEFATEEEGRSSGKEVSDDFSGIQFSDVKGTEFDDGTNLQGLNLIKEQSGYSTSTYTSFANETSLGDSETYEVGTCVLEPSEQDFDAGNIARSPRPSKDDGSGLPCGAWWKRGAASIYSHAKEANTFWSIFIAAAVMGLVILGQHWQQERWQTLQHKWQFGLNNEKASRILGPISRLKDVIVGGHRRGSLIRGSSAREN